MRDRVMLALAVGLLAVAALPGMASARGSTVAAEPSPFIAKLKRTVCSDTGSHYDHGLLKTNAQMVETGRHGVNYMTIESQFQQLDGGTWQTIIPYGPFKSPTFANNATSHTHRMPFNWPFQAPEVGKTFRWRVTFTWWDQRPGDDVRLAVRTKSTPGCTP